MGDNISDPQDFDQEPWVDPAFGKKHFGCKSDAAWSHLKRHPLFPKGVPFNGKDRFKPSWFQIFTMALAIISRRNAGVDLAEIEAELPDRFPTSTASMIERAFRLAEKQPVQPEQPAKRARSENIQKAVAERRARHSAKAGAAA